MSKVFEHWWKILKLEPMLNQNLKQLKFFSTVIEHKRPQQFGSSNVYDWLNLHLICRALIRSIFFYVFIFSSIHSHTWTVYIVSLSLRSVWWISVKQVMHDDISVLSFSVHDFCFLQMLKCRNFFLVFVQSPLLPSQK